MCNISQIKPKLQKLLKENLSLSQHEANCEIETIFDFCLSWNKTERELKQNQNLPQNILEQIENIVSERLKRIPLQYILGQAYFYGLKLKVNSKVLIPRPETELMVEMALQKLKNINKPKILEIGTGSGCISIALASQLQTKNPQIIATDISPDCLQIAQENAQTHKVQSFINFELADLVNEKHLQTNFDLLISNPPYIAEDEFESLSAEVKCEPYIALITNKGLECFERIAKLNLKTRHILFELDPKRAEQIQEIFGGTIYLDLNCFKRFLMV